MPGRFTSVFEIKGLRKFRRPFSMPASKQRSGRPAAAAPKNYPQNPRGAWPLEGARPLGDFVESLPLFSGITFFYQGLR